MGSGWLGVMGAAVLVSARCPPRHRSAPPAIPLQATRPGSSPIPARPIPRLAGPSSSSQSDPRFRAIMPLSRRQCRADGTPAVVFAGDSITDNWINFDPTFFSNGVIDRGIGGKRRRSCGAVRQDVIDLHPQAVHIMIGTNDIAGNTVRQRSRRWKGISRAWRSWRARMASGDPRLRAPAGAFPWAKDKQPVPQIAALNAWIRDMPSARGSPMSIIIPCWTTGKAR